MGADGFKVQTESIQSMLFGGIAFESPETLEQATTDIDKLVFTLHESYESIKKHAYTKKIKFIMFFDSSIRGLNLGAPVEFKGIKVGTVLDVRLEFDSGSTSFRIPVLIEIEPQRIIERGNQEMDQSHQALQRLVKRGLRARLQTGSLLTSQLFVELDMHPGSPINLSGSDTPYPELPTLPTSNFGAITQSAEDLLAKLNAVDIKEVTSVLIDTIQTANKTMHNADKAIESANTLIGTAGIPEAIENVGEIIIKSNQTLSNANKAIDSMISTADNANKLITSPGITESIEDIRVSLKNFKSIMLKVDNSKIQEAIAAGHLALENLSQTLDKTSKIMEPNSPIQYNLIELTKEFEETSRAIRSLIETLERNPQELIFGKDRNAKGE